MAIETAIQELKINLLTKAQYNEALQKNQINDNELYLTNVESEIITDATSGSKTPAILLNSLNTEWRYTYASGITNLTLQTSDSFTINSNAYYSFVFKSGTTATTITNSLYANFKGDDCINGSFIPSSNKTYEVCIWWNGFNWLGIVRGY